jgi:uncharacterized membrane protein YgcG
MDKKLINIITQTSAQVIKGAGITKKDEFVDTLGNKVAEGIPYHIHRTYDKQEFYMTSAEHESTSILIFRNKGEVSDFYKYKSLISKKSQIYLEETRTFPSQHDYEEGFFTIYFAKLGSDKNSKTFQITKNDYDQDTPLYEKGRTTLKITGDIFDVIKFNEPRIESLEISFPGISLQLPLNSIKFYKQSRFSTSSPTTTSGGSTAGSTGGSSGGSSGGGGGGY